MPQLQAKYVGQTDRILHMIKEHLQSIKKSNNNSKSVKHPCNYNYAFGSPEEITDVLHVINNGNHINTIKNFTHIQNLKKKRTLSAHLV